jgi:DNA mismatch repair ATPase MutS
VARELEIVLTSRNVAKGTRVPMAGIPHHAAESYLAKLIAAATTWRSANKSARLRRAGCSHVR